MASSRIKDKLKQSARATTQAARATADKSAQKTGAKNQEKSTPVRNVKARTQAAAQKATNTAKEQNRTPKRKPTVKNAVRQTAAKVSGTKQVQQNRRDESTARNFLDRQRFIDDMTARSVVRQDNVGRGRSLPQKASGKLKELGMEKYTEPGRKENNPNTPSGMYKTTLTSSELDQMVQDEELSRRGYGLGSEKVPVTDILPASRMDPLSLLTADSMSHANFGRGGAVKTKDKTAGLSTKEANKIIVQDVVDRLTANTRKKGAKQQTLSRHDNKLSPQFRDEIKLAKQDYDAAKRKGDAKGMEEAHRRAETWRRLEGGYSGGETGSEYITPELSREDKANLTKEGQTRLAAAKLGYANAKTDEERKRYAAQGEAIRKDPTLQKGEYDRGAYRETDAEGRMRYGGSTEERQKEAEQAAAIPKAIGTGVAGSFAALPETTRRALQADAARNQDFLQALSDIRGGGDVNISEPGAVDPNSLGQRLLRQSQEYREKATEGQRGLERYLTEALITGGEMAPGLLATALSGGAAAPGLAVMGAQAAGQRMGDLESQGVDPVQAFNRGVLSGAIEAGSELIPLWNLAKIARGGGDNFARNLATLALAEVGTEEASEIGNYLTDRAFRDPNASLTAQDLIDTAAISALTSLGMGAGAGIVGSRRTGQTQEQQAQERKTTAALDQITPTADDLMEQAQALQNRVALWHQQGARLQDRLANSTQDPTWHKHLLAELEQHEAERKQLEQELIGLEMQKAQRTQIEQEKAQQAQRQAEEAQRAEQERLDAQEVRDTDVSTLPPASPVPLLLARGGERTAQAPAQALRGAAEQTERLDSLQLPLAEDPERRAAQEKRLAGKPLSMKEQLMERDTGSMVKTIAGRETRTDHAYRVVPLSQWEQEYMPSGKISRNAAEFDPNGDEHASNGGVDWYLGGYSKRYGGKNGTVVILEAPAVTSKFQTAQDNGTRMTLDPTVRHIKSSSKANPVELSELTGAWKWDKRTGEITEIDLSPWKRATRNNSLTPLEVPQRARERAQEPEGSRATSARYGQAENHINNRTAENLGDRKVKAFQWDHPEVKPFYQKAAEALKADAEYSESTRHSVRASKIDQARGKQAGTVMERNDTLRNLARMGLSTQDIIKACDAIIHDQGQENYAAAKRVELALDQMLSKGYDPVEGGGHPDYHVGPDEEYLRLKGEISGGTTPGSWEAYRQDHDFLIETGEVTEDELRREWEAARSGTQQTAEEGTEDTSPPVFQTKEEELAYLRGRAESLVSQREQAANGTEEDQARWDREWNQLNADIQAAQERWSGQEEEAEAEEERYSVGAAPSGFDPYTHAINEYGAIEPGENPARMVDVPLSTNGEDRVRRYARTAMEAEVTPDEAMTAFEQDVAKGLFSYHPRRDADAVAAARNTIESKGYDGALQQWNDVVEGRRIAGKDDVVLAQMLYSLAAQNGDINTVRRLAAEIAAEGTVSGQKIQALRLLKKATPEGKLYYIRKTVGKLQDDLNRSRGDKAPTLEIDPELEEALLDAGTQEEQQDVLDRIYDDVAKQIPATLGDRLNAWRYFAMLGNPRTHIRNVVGNIVVQAPLQVSNKASALVQAALPKEQRTRAVVASREAKRFARDDYQYMKDVLSGDKYISEESEIKRRQKTAPKPVQALMDFNSKALEAEDMIFKKGTYIQSLASFITARGWDPQTMTAGQLEQARTHAIKDARHATFQNESALASAIAKLERKNRATKVAIGGLVPFKGVPINIAKMGFDLSPAGLAKAITYDAAQVKKGNMDATDMIDHLTRGLTGTSVAALGYFLAAQGWLTAGADDDDKENYFNMAQGSQEYALDLEAVPYFGKRYLKGYNYTIDWAAPSAIPLFLGAEYFNARQKWGEESDDESKAFKDGLESLSRLFDPMLNMTVLSGVSDTLNTISYSQTNPIFPLAWGIGQNYLGQFVPTLSGQIARTVDDTRRTTYIDRESPVPNSIQRFIQRQENKIPGLSQRNLPYLDSWGREDRTESPLLRAFENFLSPGYVSKRNTDAVDEELQRLHDLDYEGVLPSKAQTNTKINDRYLSKDEYEKLVKTQGGQARNMLAEVIGTPEYQGLTDDEKAAYVKKIFDFSKQIGKLEAGMPEEKADSYVLKAKEGQDTLGLDPSKYLAMAALKASIDKDETTDDKTMKAIDFSLAVDARGDMTDEQKAFVKDNIKFFNMFPVSTSGFEKGIAAGLTAEESKEMLALKKTADTDGNNSYTNLEIYDAINNSDLSDEKKAQYWEAMKPANTKKSWTDIQKESKEAAATREKWSASIGDVSQETIDTFNGNVNSIGGYNQMSYTAFFDMMDSMGVPESQRAGYYAIVQSNKGHPWKKTYAQAKKYKGR